MSTNAISEIVKFKDVNKSTIFLYELLQVRNKSAMPVGTYMGVNGCSIFKDMNLICLFHKAQEGFTEIDLELRNHEQFDFFVDDPDDYRYHVMDFSMMPAIYNVIKAGKYSQLSQNAKTIINLGNHPVGWIGVNPRLYYEEFANEYGVSIETLEKNIELLEPPSKTNETLNLPEKIAKLFIA